VQAPKTDACRHTPSFEVASELSLARGSRSVHLGGTVTTWVFCASSGMQNHTVLSSRSLQSHYYTRDKSLLTLLA